MATPISIFLPKGESAHFEPVFGIFHEVDRELSSYKEDSPISQLNQRKSLDASPFVLEILKRSIEIARISNGAFDPTIGAITLQTYRFGYSPGKPPTPNDIQRAKNAVDYRKIKISGKRVAIGPQTWLDLGGIGKGFAVDKASDYLVQKNITSAVIAASGDIRCLGSCSSAIQDPFNENQNLVAFRTKGPIALSTSGSYIKKRSQKVHHLIKPDTGKSAQTFVSVTLYALGDNTTLDALTTAAFVTPMTEVLSLLNQFKGVEFFFVLSDRTIWHSPGFFDYLEDVSWATNKADFKIKVADKKKIN